VRDCGATEQEALAALDREIVIALSSCACRTNVSMSSDSMPSAITKAPVRRA
jgi:hypothetical protein